MDMPDDPAQLRAWLESIGLEDADVLAIFGNDDLAELDPEQLRMLHGLLEARWSIDHPETERGELFPQHQAGPRHGGHLRP
jgi:hypothetical protein